jgi:hypothetical protein
VGGGGSGKYAILPWVVVVVVGGCCGWWVDVGGDVVKQPVHLVDNY